MTAQLILLAEVAVAEVAGVLEPPLAALSILLAGLLIFTVVTAGAEAAEMKALGATVKAAF